MIDLRILPMLLFATAAAAQDDVAPLVRNPLEEGDSLSGTWTYSTSNHKVSGDCPLGPVMRGQLVIAVRGNVASVMIASGAACNPPSMCLFMGEMDRTAMVVSNSDVVDDEGGTATNALSLSFYSETEGTGKSSSRYSHPKGFECAWTHDVSLSREKD